MRQIFFSKSHKTLEKLTALCDVVPRVVTIRVRDCGMLFDTLSMRDSTVRVSSRAFHFMNDDVQRPDARVNNSRREFSMNIIVRRKLDMATRVRTFSRAHPSTEPTYTTVLGRLEERLTEAEAIATKQYEARVAARGARNTRKELRRTVHFQLLKYLVIVGKVAAKSRTELATQFRLPSVSANNQAFLTVVKALVAAAEQQRDVLVAAGMAPALLEELQQKLAAFETASEEARARRLSHIGARTDLEKITGSLMDAVRVLDGINRWRFAKDPEVMAEWEAARHLLPSRPADEPVQVTDRAAPAA